MKINIFVSLRKGPFGGGNQFLKSLKNYFVLKGYYVEKPENADIIIFNSYPFREEYRFKKAYQFKKKGKILIHRIDGPIFKIRNRDLKVDKIIYKFNQFLADGTVFQSNWCKSENCQLGINKNRYETIIYNASDKEIFNNLNKLEFNKNRIYYF